MYNHIFANTYPCLLFPASINATCVPSVGMFTLLKKQNYTEGQLECKNNTGILADVMSEHRTDLLAQMLNGAKVEIAYVGLNRNSDNGTAYTSDTGSVFFMGLYFHLF